MKLTIEIYDIDPLDKLVGTGPGDERGVPTVTAADFAKAKAESEAGKRWYFGRAQFFPVGCDGGLEMSYSLPPGLEPAVAFTRILSALSQNVRDSGILLEKK